MKAQCTYIHYILFDLNSNSNFPPLWYSKKHYINILSLLTVREPLFCWHFNIFLFYNIKFNFFFFLFSSTNPKYKWYCYCYFVCSLRTWCNLIWLTPVYLIFVFNNNTYMIICVTVLFQILLKNVFRYHFFYILNILEFGS